MRVSTLAQATESRWVVLLVRRKPASRVDQQPIVLKPLSLPLVLRTRADTFTAVPLGW